MRQGHVHCPACKLGLFVPGNKGKYTVGCAHCGHRFTITVRQSGCSDDEIAGWLKRPKKPDDVPADGAVPPGVVPKPGSAPAASLEPAGDQAEIRLVRIDRRGPLLEFPAALLDQGGFRCAMPRKCLHCGTDRHLIAHVIIYAPHLTDSVSLEAEHNAGTLRFTEAETRGLLGQALLDRLARVPNVPPPADQPMPYWTCDMCSGSGCISGQIQVNSETRRGLCRLQIHNLRRTEEFLRNAGAEHTPAHTELLERIAQTAENPWDALAEVVQHRLQQWFRPGSGERFVAYVPDRTRSRTEDGMAGLVVSDQRIIYHGPMRHREIRVENPVEIQLAMSRGKGHLQINTPAWRLRNITVDRAGVEDFRRALSAAHCHASWR